MLTSLRTPTVLLLQAVSCPSFVKLDLLVFGDAESVQETVMLQILMKKYWKMVRKTRIQQERN